MEGVTWGVFSAGVGITKTDETPSSAVLLNPLAWWRNFPERAWKGYEASPRAARDATRATEAELVKRMLEMMPLVS